MSRLARYPRHALALAVAAGLALAPESAGTCAVAGAVYAAGCALAGFRSAVVVASCGLLIAGAACGALRLTEIDADPLAQFSPARQVTVRGYLTEHPRANAFGVTLRMRVVLSGGRSQQIELRARHSLPGDARIGDEITAAGRFAAIDPSSARTPQSARYARYLRRIGVRRRLDAEFVTLTGRRRAGWPGVVDAIRTRSERALASGLAPEPAALLRGMVLGGNSGIPQATADDFQIAGLNHILAVSGQNVLLIVILVQAIAIALNVPRFWRLLVPAALICLYVPLCGAQASVLRAGAMGLAGLAALAASRPSSRVYALLLAAIFVLAWNPRATADVGAQLSFAAVLGLMAFARPFAARLRRLPLWAAEGLGATVAATFATTPLMVFHFGVVSIVSPLANLFGEPLIGPIVWLGSLAAAAGQVAPALGTLLNAPTGFLLGALIELAHFSASLPYAQVDAAGFGVSELIIASALVVTAAALANQWIVPPATVRQIAWRWRLAAPSRHVVLGCLLFALAAAALLTWPSKPQPPRPSIAFIDVGQGDATLLLGRDCNALIDGGPPGARLEQKLRRLGVGRLSLVLVTHPQLDHYGGIGEIVASGRLPIGSFLDGGAAQHDPAYDAIRRRLTRAHVPTTPAVSGVVWRCGDLELRVIAPGRAAAARPVSDPNTLAAVTLVDAGSVAMLASGDAESPQLAPLTLPRVDVLKVPHHGSADSGLPSVLQRVDPELAVIEVGANNSYGHPATSTLQALRSSGATVLRTDRDGTVIVSADAQGALRARRAAG